MAHKEITNGQGINAPNGGLGWIFSRLPNKPGDIKKMNEEQPPVEKASFEDFKVFHEKHPDLDNSEYYAEFPTVHKSTVRSWKARASKVEAPTINTSTGTSDANTKHYIELLLTQTKSKAMEFEDIDDKSTIIILKNRLRIQQEEASSRSPPSNSSILPSPAPIGPSQKKFGIDKYIVFDKNLNEIRMEIPMTELMDPETNKKIRERIQ